VQTTTGRVERTIYLKLEEYAKRRNWTITRALNFILEDYLESIGKADVGECVPRTQYISPFGQALDTLAENALAKVAKHAMPETEETHTNRVLAYVDRRLSKGGSA
jgi:hypothetical protein